MVQLKRLMSHLRGEAAYVLCEWLDVYAHRRTSHTKVAAATALAVREVLDIEAALTSSDLPPQVSGLLAEFEPEEWRQLLAIARSEVRLLEIELNRSDWSYLRASAGA